MGRLELLVVLDSGKDLVPLDLDAQGLEEVSVEAVEAGDSLFFGPMILRLLEWSLKDLHGEKAPKELAHRDSGDFGAPTPPTAGYVDPEILQKEQSIALSLQRLRDFEPIGSLKG